MSEKLHKNMFDGHQNTWVALSSNEERIVASAISFSDARAQAVAKGEERPVMFKVPPKSGGYLL